MALRKMLVQFSDLAFVALECQICAALAKVQPAQPPLRMSSNLAPLAPHHYPILIIITSNQISQPLRSSSASAGDSSGSSTASIMSVPVRGHSAATMSSSAVYRARDGG